MGTTRPESDSVFTSYGRQFSTICCIFVTTLSVMLDNMIEKIVILYGVHNTWVILSVCHIMSHFSVSLANLGIYSRYTI